MITSRSRIIMGKLFGTDGIRGKAGEYPLDPETVFKIGAAFATVFSEKLGRRPKFVSGRDTRESGPSIEAAFHAGAASRGAEGETSGLKTTPGVAFLAGLGFDAGVVVTASHNPFSDNGIKIFLPNGTKIEKADEAAIEANIIANESQGPFEVSALSEQRVAELEGAYFFHLWGRSGHLDLGDRKIIVDCANGAASRIARVVLGRLGTDVHFMNCQPNGRNINENCGSLHLDQLQAKVIAEQAAFGVAFDGDADRALFVDEKGAIVDGDAVLWILANRLREQDELKSNKVVGTVMSNLGLGSAFRDIGVELIRAQVGDKYVLDELFRTGAEIGGEQSGHIIIRQLGFTGDGISTALAVLEAIVSSGRSFSELHQGLIKFPQVLLNVPVKEKKPFGEVASIAEAAEGVTEALGADGRLLLRYSGTEDLARIMIEGKEQANIEQLANGLASVIEKELG